jgi:LuxR family transcriptional regulator, maltose regulon positive regulatory protein
VPRPRLLEQVARRWDRRLTTVIAGPGFGKSALLAESHRASSDDAHHDAWLTCEPRDAGGDDLLAGIAVAAGLHADASLPELVDAIWARAPDQLCVVLDDVHEVPGGSPGAGVLAALVAELPGNGHVVLASRDVAPVPTARLAAAGELVRVGEDDLLLRHDELEALAVARGVDVAILERSGGWPALAELLASAGEDLVPEYLWEEVLDRLGRARAELLARFGLVGGGGDEVVAALVEDPPTAAELVRSVPLVSRTADGWVGLHALWEPALRRLVDEERRLDDLRRVGAVHRRHGRTGLAVELLAEAGAWDDVLELIREQAVRPDAARHPRSFERWSSTLPRALGDRPEAQLAHALTSAKHPTASTLAAFEAARFGFRARGDVAAELATIEHEGVLRWWAADLAGLFELHQRLLELVAAGSREAAQLSAIGNAAIAHLGADSAAVLSHLADVEISADSGWSAMVRWFRSVAHRRDGNLELARAELAGHTADDPQGEIACLRIDWLAGAIDHVPDRLEQLAHQYETHQDLYLCRETLLELACRTAWLGDVPRTRALLDHATELTPDLDSPLSAVLRAIARGASAVAEGDEAAAAAIVREHAVPALGRPESWYWRDRAATALVRLLAPETAEAWQREPLGPAHRPGLALAEVLEAARADDGAALRAFHWPSPGIVRAHLPHRWVVELAAAALAATGTTPDGVLDRGDPQLRPILRELAASPSSLVSGGASTLLSRFPALPTRAVAIAVVGPLEVSVGGRRTDHPNLHRARVRELLCYLVAHGRRRREEVTDELWPGHDDGGRNLRTTLNYLHAVLEPDRGRGEPTYFVRSEGAWLVLERIERLSTDLWELEDRFEQAERAEQDGAPAAALAAYDSLLPLWRGEPFVDGGGALWAHAAAAALRSRYVRAARRAAELHLAAHHLADAEDAARRVLQAEPTSGVGHRLLVQANLARDDLTGARTAVAAYREVMADLGLEPDTSVVGLLR